MALYHRILSLALKSIGDSRTDGEKLNIGGVGITAKSIKSTLLFDHDGPGKLIR